MDAAIDERDEYVAILQAMVLKPLRSVEEFSQEYRRRFHTQQVHTRSASSLQRRSVSPAHTTENITEDVSEIRRRRAERAFSPSAANLTFHPTITRVSQQLQLATKDCYQRLYVDDLQNRVQKAVVRQQEREYERQREEEEELRHLAVAHKPPTVEPDRLFARLYSSGRSHEKWVQAERKHQEELLEMERAKKSPSRYDSSATKRSERNVFEDLYRQRRDASRHDDLETRHVDTPKQGLRKSSPAATHLDQVHQRLYSEAAERQHVLEIVQEVKRSSDMEGLFHPNLPLARKESTIKPDSVLHAHQHAAAGTASAPHDAASTASLGAASAPSVNDNTMVAAGGATRGRSSSPVVIQGIEALDEAPLESAITPRPAGCMPAEKQRSAADVQAAPAPRQPSPPRAEALEKGSTNHADAPVKYPEPTTPTTAPAAAARPPVVINSSPASATTPPSLSSEHTHERDDGGAVASPAEEKTGLRKAPSSRPLPVEFKKEVPTTRPVVPDLPNQSSQPPPPAGATPGRAPPSMIPTRHGHSGGSRDPPAVPSKHHVHASTPPSSTSAREAAAAQLPAPVATTPDADVRHQAVQPVIDEGPVTTAQEPPQERRGRTFRTAEEQAAYEQHKQEKREKREKRAERKRQEEILTSAWTADTQHHGDASAQAPRQHHHDRSTGAPSGSPGRRGATPPPKEKRDVPKPEALFASPPSAASPGRADATDGTLVRLPSVNLENTTKNDEPTKEMLQRRQSRKAIIESMAVLDSPSNS